MIGLDSRTPSPRGQSELLGSIIVFALFVAVIGLVQVHAVPPANEEVEFDHSLRVQGDMQALGQAALGAATNGREEVVTVEYGTRYPNRMFLLNPPSPTGTLRTVDTGTVTVENAVADGQLGDYLNGSDLSFATAAVAYTPTYNRYRNSPETRVEYPVTFNRFDGADRVIGQAPFVDGRRITLLVLAGDLSTARGSDGNVHLDPVSAPATPVAVTNRTEPLVVSVPTTLSNDTWSSLLADQYRSAGGHIVAQEVREGPPGEVDRLVLEFEPGVTYELRLGKVGVNHVPPTGESARYAVAAGGNWSSVREGEEVRVRVQVRDRFNNPVGGALVEANGSLLAGDGITGDGVSTTTPPVGNDSRAVTNENGVATFVYTAPSTGISSIERVRFSLDIRGQDGPESRVPYTVEIRDSTFTTGGTGSSTGSSPTGTGSGFPTVQRLEVTADDVDASLGTAEQVSYVYNVTDDVGVHEVRTTISHVEYRGATNETVGERRNLPPRGNETIGLDGDPENAVSLSGSDELLVNVTAVDAAGNRRTCLGWIDAADETIRERDGDFTCTTRTGSGGSS